MTFLRKLRRFGMVKNRTSFQLGEVFTAELRRLVEVVVVE